MSSKQTRHSVAGDGEKKKLRFLIIAPTPFFVSRGTPIRILEEARALERRGHEITLVSYHIGEEISLKANARIDHRRIRRWLFWYKKTEAGANWQKILLDIMLFRKAFSLARKQHPDIIYAHLHEGALIGWMVQKFLFWKRMLLVCDFHGGLTSEMSSHGYLKNTMLATIFYWMERCINGLGDIAVASSWENAHAINKCRSENKCAHTLPDGATVLFPFWKEDKEWEKKNRLKKHFRSRFALPENKYIFAYTGALIPNKGLDVLVLSIQKFLALGGDAHFVLAGFPVEYADRLVRENALMENVTIISPLDWFDLPELLAVVDAGIDPKGSETNQASGKILQYMGAGLPVICFDRESNKKFLGEGGVCAREGTDLSREFLWCVQHKEEAEEKGCINRRRARRFSWDRSAKRMEALIQEARKSKKS